jgi:hypothetical protein
VSTYAASVTEIADELGVSRSTVKRAEATALAKLAEAMTAGSGPEIVVTFTPMEALYLFGSVARRRYLARLMRCRPHTEPADDPPPGL